MKVHEEGTGAVRSNDLAVERWDLISGVALSLLPPSMSLARYDLKPIELVNDAVANLYNFLGNVTTNEDRLDWVRHEGATKYGEHNWLHGFHVAGLANHGIRHMVRWTNGDRSEDHLGHTMWSFMTITHMYTHRPDMCTLLLGVDYTLTDEIIAKFPFKKREPMDVDRKSRDVAIASEFEKKVRDSQRARGSFGDPPHNIQQQTDRSHGEL
jgi:hypothetical protein